MCVYFTRKELEGERERAREREGERDGKEEAGNFILMNFLRMMDYKHVGESEKDTNRMNMAFDYHYANGILIISLLCFFSIL